MSQDNFKSLGRNLKDQAKVLGGFVAIIWIVEIVDYIVFRGNLDRFGIRPRNLDSSIGILFAPFLHGSFTHTAANTVPFLVLGWLVSLRSLSDFFTVSIVGAFISGLGTWLVGAANSIHVGASGMIYSYLGYLLFRGYFERKPIAIFLAILVAVMYGGIIWGVLPQRSGISWEGHLFGFLGGIVAARLLSKESISENQNL
jgi:membrane associated rhomboid family serine protease